MKDNIRISVKNLSEFRKKNLHKKIVLAGGGFDIIHLGHIEHLAWSKSKGDILMVHVTGEKRFIEKKRRKPLFSVTERARIISTLKPVDYVFVYNGRQYDEKILNTLRPDIIVFNKESLSSAIKEKLKTFEGKVLISNLKKKNSSRTLVQKL